MNQVPTPWGLLPLPDPDVKRKDPSIACFVIFALVAIVVVIGMIFLADSIGE